jgi:hypothetical protein
MSQSNEPVGEGSVSGSMKSGERTSARGGKFWSRVEREVEEDFGKALRALQRRPSVGTVLVGVAAVLAAEAIGVGEVALGVALGYAAYRVLRQGPSSRATTPTSSAEGVEHGGQER